MDPRIREDDKLKQLSFARCPIKTNNKHIRTNMISSTLPKPLTYLCLVIAGSIQTLTLAPFGFWFLGPISIALALFATHALAPSLSSKPEDPKQGGFFYGWLFGLGLFGSGASWVYVSIHTYGHAPPFLAGAFTVIFVTGLSLFSALVFSLYFKLRTKSPVVNSLLFLSAWVIGDGFRTVFLTGFPWLFLGYGHLESPLSGWVPIVGIYGLTAITVGTGISIALFFSATAKKTKIATALITLAFWAAGPPLNAISWVNETKPALNVALIQTNIPQEEKWKPSQRRKTLKLLDNMTEEQWQRDTKNDNSKHTDLIIWPETAIPMLYNQALPFINNMSEKAAKNNSNIISGIPYRQIDKNSGAQSLHNSIFSIGMGDGIYHKQRLVPFGEYVPLQDILRGLIAFFDMPMSDFRRGKTDQPLLKSFDYLVSPFICYEVVYPDFVASRARDSDYLLTISNDSWFGRSIGPLQHLEMAQMRAAENGRFMVRGTNNGISAIIDEKGFITAKSEQFVRTTLESEVKIFSGRTPFSYLGSYPLFLVFGLYLLWYLFGDLKTRKHSRKVSA